MVLDLWRPRFMRRLNPMDDLDEVARQLQESWPRSVWYRLTGNGMISPSLEFIEKEDAFVIRVELPGVSKDDVDISVSGDTLTIKGERKAPANLKDEECTCSEMRYGKFSRSISLPDSVDTGKTDASLQNGVLELRIPKVKKAIPAKVEIKTTS